MKLVEWQYYPSWWPFITYSYTITDYCRMCWYEYWISIGPIQTRWRGRNVYL